MPSAYRLISRLCEANYGPASLDPELFEDLFDQIVNFVMAAAEYAKKHRVNDWHRTRIADRKTGEVILEVEVVFDGSSARSGGYERRSTGYHEKTWHPRYGSGTRYRVEPDKIYIHTSQHPDVDTVRNVVRHELTHFFQGQLPGSGFANPGEKLKNLPPEGHPEREAKLLKLRKQYNFHPHEIEAFTQSIIAEMLAYAAKTGDTDFNRAISQSKTYSYYKRATTNWLGNRFGTINKIRAKIVNFWLRDRDRALAHYTGKSPGSMKKRGKRVDDVSELFYEPKPRLGYDYGA